MKDAATFITWRLHGSLPVHLRSRPEDGPGQAFVRRDRTLDAVTTGPVWLARPELAAVVEDSLWHCAIVLCRFDLHACVVMPNHVHVLLHARADLRISLNRLKSHTALAANRLLDRTGQRFWQGESCDHWVRTNAEFNKILHYIENNLVQAGLAVPPAAWRWSSAWARANDPSRAADLAVAYRGVSAP